MNTRSLRWALSIASRSEPRLDGARVALVPGLEGRNLVAKAGARGGTFFVKLRCEPKDDALRERWALARLPNGLGPRLVFAANLRGASPERAPDAGALLVMSEVAGRPMKELNEASIAAVARAAAELHSVVAKSGPVLAGGADAPAMLVTMRNMIPRIERRATLATRSLRALRAELASVTRDVEDAWLGVTRVPRRLCHGDLQPKNVMIRPDGSADLVDFELAGRGDPMIDLAMFSALGELSRHQELCLLDSYAEALGGKDLSRYFAYRRLMPLFLALGGLDQMGAALARGRSPTWVAKKLPMLERRLVALIGAVEPVRLRARAS